jgi:hypothetical protein
MVTVRVNGIQPGPQEALQVPAGNHSPRTQSLGQAMITQGIVSMVTIVSQD